MPRSFSPTLLPKMPPSTPSSQMTPKGTPPYRHLPPLDTNPPRPMKQQSFLGLDPPGGPGYRKHGLLLRPHRRTNPMIWCGAVLCVIFSVLLILAGVVILIIFLVIKPKSPSFEITAATLNGIYLDSPARFNGDLTLLANFSNPNTKIDLAFEYSSIELYYYDRLVSARALEPFVQRRGERRLEPVHMVSSEVYLPPELTVRMQKEVGSNRVMYTVRGTFKVRASFGVGHLTYWIYGRCQIVLSGPPGGILVARSCRTKR